MNIDINYYKSESIKLARIENENDYQTKIKQARSIDIAEKSLICPNFKYVFHAELELGLNWNFPNERERWCLLFADTLLPIGWNYHLEVNDRSPIQIVWYPSNTLIIFHNAKIKYNCFTCSNHWTSARGRAIFKAQALTMNTYNCLFIQLCTQQCRLCYMEIEPSWYLSETSRIMKNVCRILIEQFYSHRNFILPSIQQKNSVEAEAEQKESCAHGRHEEYLCQACRDGYCFDSCKKY